MIETNDFQFEIKALLLRGYTDNCISFHLIALDAAASALDSGGQCIAPEVPLLSALWRKLCSKLEIKESAKIITFAPIFTFTF